MKITRLEIEQQRAEISIETQKAQLHVEMPDRRLKISSEVPQMTVHREDGSIELDMDEFKSNLGLKNYDVLTKDAVSKAYQESAQGIRDIVNNAAFVGDPSINGNKVAMAAKDKMLESVDISTGRSSVPPKIEMEGNPGSLEINWTKGDVSIELEGKGQLDVYAEPPCSVEIELSQHPIVRVALVEESIPSAVGRSVSTKI